MAKIIIAGLGPVESGSLSIDSLEILKGAKFLVLLTSQLPVVSSLNKEQIGFDTFERIGQELAESEDADEIISRELISLTKEHEEVVFGVPGHPLLGQSITTRLAEQTTKLGIALEIIPSLCSRDSALAGSATHFLRNVQVIDASEIAEHDVTPSLDLIVTGGLDQSIASDLKSQLLNFYRSSSPVLIVQNMEPENKAGLIYCLITQLDQCKELSNKTSLYLPASRFPVGATFFDLVRIMAKLRGPTGCPWDRQQTHDSLKRHLIEESYEVIETIDAGDSEHLMEELGDLLLQTIFHAQIASEQGDFDISDVLENIVTKLLRRHPHIFGDKQAETPEDVMVHWEEAKRKEGKAKILSGLPQSLPALLYALKLQKKAAHVGFDWEEKQDIAEKLLEEAEEFKEACLQGQDHQELEEEIGDVLFTIVNIARHYDIDPESALRKTSKKFKRRFEYIEEQAEMKKVLLADMPLDEKEKLWQEAKKQEKAF